MTELKSELIQLTSAYLNRPDWVQGPGGNTSVKDNGIMAIKASGMRFEEIDTKIGISLVELPKIINFLNESFSGNKIQNETELLNIVEESRMNTEFDVLSPKPSMETGFHAVLKKYVVHTHSVWSNLINCCNEPVIKQKINDNCNFKLSFVPFCTPGFELSKKIQSIYKEHPQTEVFLLQNHGVIAHADNMESVFYLLSELDDQIKAILNIEEDYPNTSLMQLNENIWRPEVPFIHEIMTMYNANEGFLYQVLFPDQIVFFKGNFNFENDLKKKINVHRDSVNYVCNEREAKSLHENLSAFLFLYHSIKSKNLKMQFIDVESIDYINNMEMEKHRKNLMKP
jgi:ribulose-5-phosphate 4-epimerase/fuculose-1-phosphate aldolase